MRRTTVWFSIMVLGLPIFACLTLLLTPIMVARVLWEEFTDSGMSDIWNPVEWWYEFCKDAS